MEKEIRYIFDLVLDGVSFIVNTPLAAILFSIPTFIWGLSLFKRSMTIENSLGYAFARAIGTSIGLFVLSIMLIINAVLTLINK